MRIKVTEKSLDKARDMAAKQVDAINQLRVFISKFDEDFWALVVERLGARVKALQDSRDGGAHLMSESELKANCAVDKELRRVMSLPEEAQRKLDALMAAHDKLKSELNERATHIKE